MVVLFLKEHSKSSEWLIQYIKEQKISIKQMAADLHIDEDRFVDGAVFGIEEFLDICGYLHITPERVQKEIRENDKVSM